MMGRLIGLAAVLLASVGPALAQDGARARELATAYVLIDGSTATPIGHGYADNMIATLDDDYSISEDKQAWMREVFPIAEAAASARFEGTVESWLIDAFVERFSEAELEELLTIQAFLAQPAIKSVLESDYRSDPLAAIETLRQNLSSDDFRKLIRLLTAPLARAAATLTSAEAARMRDEFRFEFDKAVKAQCGSAPAGMAICER